VGVNRMWRISTCCPRILSTVRICQPNSVLNGLDTSPSCILKATSRNSFTIRGRLRCRVYFPPLARDPGSCEYKIALEPKLNPFSSTSFLKPLSWSIMRFFSASVTCGSTTIWAISTSVPKTGRSSSGIESKNWRTSSGVTSTFSTMSACIIWESFCTLLIWKSSSRKDSSSVFL